MVRKKVYNDGSIRYFNEKGQYHREDGPAVEFNSKYNNKYKYYYINGLRHRIDGPAMEYPDGDKSYFIMGECYSYEAWLSIKDFPLLW